MQWNLAFPVFISPVVWNTCENLHYESLYFKELHNNQEYYWPTIYRAGAAVVSAITSLMVQWPLRSVPIILLGYREMASDRTYFSLIVRNYVSYKTHCTIKTTFKFVLLSQL